MINPNIIRWLRYTEQEVLEPKKHLFHFKRKKIKQYVDIYGMVKSVNFDSDWNDLMTLVDSIEILGYSIFISLYEIRIERDFSNNPYLIPNVILTYPRNRKDRDRKSSVYNICLLFIEKYNTIK